MSLSNRLMSHSMPLYSFSDDIKLSAEFNTGKLLSETFQAFNNNIKDSIIYTSDQVNVDFLGLANVDLSLFSLMSKMNYDSQTYTDAIEPNATSYSTNHPSVPNLTHTFSMPNWSIQSSRKYKFVSCLDKNQDSQISPNSLAGELASMNLSDSNANANEQGDTVKVHDLKKSLYFILSRSLLKLSINDRFAIKLSI